MRIILFLLLTVSIFGCDSKSNIESEIEKIPMNIEVVRFDREFAAVTVEGLPALKQKYPQFFPKQYPDSIWHARLIDSFQLGLNTAVAKSFPTKEKIEDAMLPLFQHIKYYFPQFKEPTIVTTTSYVDYQAKVIVADSLMIIALDTYLGRNHEFYEGISEYIKKNLDESQLASDAAGEYARQLVKRPSERSLIAQMVTYGKELYLKQIFLPNHTDAQIMGFSDAEMVWADENEIEIWRYFIDRELLYSTDAKLLPRFIYNAPFTKFDLELDNESPGMLGRFIGWKIVRSYMDQTNLEPRELLVINPEELFNKSKYKPAKN